MKNKGRLLCTDNREHLLKNGYKYLCTTSVSVWATSQYMTRGDIIPDQKCDKIKLIEDYMGKRLKSCLDLTTHDFKITKKGNIKRVKLEDNTQVLTPEVVDCVLDKTCGTMHELIEAYRKILASAKLWDCIVTLDGVKVLPVNMYEPDQIVYNQVFESIDWRLPDHDNRDSVQFGTVRLYDLERYNFSLTVQENILVSSLIFIYEDSTFDHVGVALHNPTN